jgi:hypothetical protein
MECLRRCCRGRIPAANLYGQPHSDTNLREPIQTGDSTASLNEYLGQDDRAAASLRDDAHDETRAGVCMAGTLSGDARAEGCAEAPCAEIPK